jgi:polyisoprenoid-binding protein YceI
MFKNRIIIAITAVFITATAFVKTEANAQTTFKFNDKVGKNQLEWNSTMPVETIDGTAEGITGWLSFDPVKPTTITGTVSASVATMKSGNDMRDQHLQAESWLDAAKYPHITFTAKSAKNVKQSGNKYTADVTGDFSMHGVTKLMTIPVEIQYIKANAETAKRAPGDLVALTGTFTVPIKDFNVAGSKGTIGSKVGETITIKAKLYGASGL